MTPPPTPTATATPATAGWATYSAPRFAVSLSHPPDWQAAPGEESRYEGSDGFFALDAIGSPAATIDDIAAGQAGHRLLPYGSQPVIEALEVDGQEARLILPSADATMRGQAMLIVRYPQPIQLGDQVQFFALYADQDHIGAIAQTVRFL
jgi:TolB protein